MAKKSTAKETVKTTPVKSVAPAKTAPAPKKKAAKKAVKRSAPAPAAKGGKVGVNRGKLVLTGIKGNETHYIYEHEDFFHRINKPATADTNPQKEGSILEKPFHTVASISLLLDKEGFKKK